MKGFTKREDYFLAWIEKKKFFITAKWYVGPNGLTKGLNRKRFKSPQAALAALDSLTLPVVEVTEYDFDGWFPVEFKPNKGQLYLEYCPEDICRGLRKPCTVTLQNFAGKFASSKATLWQPVKLP